MAACGNRISEAEWRLWQEVILSYGIISTQTKRVTGMEREEAGVKRWDTYGCERGLRLDGGRVTAVTDQQDRQEPAEAKATEARDF